MREIKFRLWEKDLKAMIAVDNSDQFLISLDGRVFDTGFTFSHQAEYCKDMVVMQFTGLKDKNGVEICEGDIVTCSYSYYGYACTLNGYHEVKYTAETGFSPIQEPVDYDERYADADEWLVVGNIYENPELLEPK